MYLLEYEGKEMLAEYGVQLPRGQVVASPEEAAKVTDELGGKAVLKVQVAAGGRGKAGGIRKVSSSREAREAAAQLLGQPFKDKVVRRLLVEQPISVANEYYLSLVDNRMTGSPMAIVSSEGGMDIETVAALKPEKVVRYPFSFLAGLQPFEARRLAKRAGVPSGYIAVVGDVLLRLWKLYRDRDARLVEINPLAIDQEGRAVALDAKIILDDDAFIRQPKRAYAELEDLNPRELFARQRGYGYVEFNYEGTIACAATGAGLAMTSMDLINDVAPGALAFFLDVGGRFVESTGDVLKLAAMFPNLKAILITRYGGFGRGDLIAESIIKGLLEVRPKIPVMIQLSGSGEKAAIERFKEMEKTIAEAGVTFKWTSHTVTGKEGLYVVRGGINTVEGPVRQVLEWAGYSYQRRPPEWFPARGDWEELTRRQLREALSYRPEPEYRELAATE